MTIKMFTLFYVVFLSLLYTVEGIEGTGHPKQHIPCTYEKEFVETPEAFEKVYVDGSMILSMPNGTFLKHRDGTTEKIRVLSHDTHGMYVLRIRTQCPHCGQVYYGKTSPEGWNCHLYEKEIVHHVWTAP